MRRTLRFFLPALLVLLPLMLVAAAVFRAQRAFHRAATQAQNQRSLPFDLHPFDPTALRNQSPGFQPVAASASFTSGAFLHNELFLTSPAGLSVYGMDSKLRNTLRTGSELPTSPLGRVVVAHLRGASDAQILIATSGAGVLILTPGDQPHITQLLPADTSTRDITALLPTSSGDLLLGTRHRGLLIFNGTTLERVPLPIPGMDAAKLEITTLAGDASSFLVGTRTAGVLYAHAGTVDHIDATSGLPDDQVESIALAADKAYIGTPVGVAEVDLASLHAVRVLAPGVFAHTLAVDPVGTQLTIGTLDQGVQQVSLGTHARLHNASISIPPEQSAQRINQLISASPGTALYALSGADVLRGTGAAWTPVLSSSTTTLTDANISALTFSPDGRLWVGFFDRGLDILNPDLTRAQHLEDDHLFCINRLALDPAHQTMDAATANGLVLFDSAGHPRQTLTRRDGLISDHVTDLAFTPSGTVVATPAGLTFLSPTGASSLYAFEGLVNNHVYSVALSADSKQLLAGTLGGLSLLESESVRRNLTVANSGLKHNWITAIIPLPADDLAGKSTWLIGTYGAGLQRLSPNGSFTPIDLPTSTSPDLVINPNALLATPTAIYAGTLGHGLLVYQRTTQRWSIVTRGLPSLNVTAFAQRNGELYIGTENGLIHIPERTLAQFTNGGDAL
jgi:hypothetical protein